MVIYFIPLLPPPYHRSLLLKMFWRNMTRTKMNSSVLVNLLEMFVGKVRGQFINFNIKKTSLIGFLVPVASPCTASTLCLSLCVCVQESLPRSGRSKRLWDSKTSMIKIRMAGWIERSSSAGSRLIAMVRREKRWVSCVSSHVTVKID